MTEAGVSDGDDIESTLRYCLETIHFPVLGRARSGLRELVARYVDELKSQDVPPERVIVRIKELARQAGLARTTNSHPELNVADSDKLVIDLVEWSIERYYIDAASG